MKCPNCGSANRPKVKFCEECGTDLTKPKAPPRQESIFDRLAVFAARNPWRLVTLTLLACIGSMLLVNGLDWLRYPVTKGESLEMARAAVMMYYPELANLEPQIQEVKDENGETLLSYSFLDDTAVEGVNDNTRQLNYGAVALVNRKTGEVQLISTIGSSTNPEGLQDFEPVSNPVNFEPVSGFIINPRATPTETKEIIALDRCEIFEDLKMSLVWFPPPRMYFKISGGVPGLEKEISGDSGEWEYKLVVDSYYESEECRIFEGYKERLYCDITLDSTYHNSIGPLALYVNACPDPIYSNQHANIFPSGEGQPKPVVGGEGEVEGGEDCGAAPGGGCTGAYAAWCACTGGNFICGFGGPVCIHPP